MRGQISEAEVKSVMYQLLQVGNRGPIQTCCLQLPAPAAVAAPACTAVTVHNPTQHTTHEHLNTTGAAVPARQRCVAP